MKTAQASRANRFRSLSANAIGSIWMTAAMAGYVINDAIIKKTTETLPLFEAVLIRGVMISALLVAVMALRSEPMQWSVIKDRNVATRVAMETLGTIVYLLTLQQIPLSGMTAVMQLVPIIVTFVAARLLREEVSAVRVASVIAGFIGMLFVIKPGTSGFSFWYLGGVCAVAIVVVRELATKDIDPKIPTNIVAFYTAVVITVMGGGFILFQDWQTPTAAQMMALATSAVFLALAYVASVAAVRHGDLSFTAPFRYTVLVFALILEVLIFNTWPDMFTVLGAIIVSAAGLMTMRYGKNESDR